VGSEVELEVGNLFADAVVDGVGGVGAELVVGKSENEF
jgi:hypothetical protein